MHNCHLYFAKNRKYLRVQKKSSTFAVQKCAHSHFGPEKANIQLYEKNYFYACSDCNDDNSMYHQTADDRYRPQQLRYHRRCTK